MTVFNPGVIQSGAAATAIVGGLYACNASGTVAYAGQKTIDRGVDADEVPFVINQRTTGVAGVDRCVRLDEVFDFLNAEVAAAHCTHDQTAVLERLSAKL